MRARARRIAIGAGVAAGAVGVTAAVAIAATQPGGAQSAPAPSESSAPDVPAPESYDADALTADFLDEWVDDGRVVRRDQGDDTVSEGQAYGLLLAVAADREDDVDAIWSWTEREMVRDDGLLAWRWDDGGIVDAEPASDADLDAARALVLAGERFGRDDLAADGAALATAILDRMTATTELGRILLPGTWAADRTPYAYNPSYASPAAFAVLGAATGDERWAELAAGSAAVTDVILSQTDLPPDWAQVHEDGTVEAMPGAQGGGERVTFGYDAARLLVRYAESCEPTDVALAARTLPALARTAELPAELDLGGGAITEDRHPLTLVARAAAAAASDATAAQGDLRAAAQLSADVPTYYGRAWTALGSQMLEGDALGGCAPLAGSAS
jgi:endoglucanase